MATRRRAWRRRRVVLVAVVGGASADVLGGRRSRLRRRAAVEGSPVTPPTDGRAVEMKPKCSRCRLVSHRRGRRRSRKVGPPRSRPWPGTRSDVASQAPVTSRQAEGLTVTEVESVDSLGLRAPSLSPSLSSRPTRALSVRLVG